MIAVLGCLQAGAFNHCTRVIPRLFVAILTVISDAFQVLSEALSIYSSPVTSLYRNVSKQYFVHTARIIKFATIGTRTTRGLILCYAYVSKIRKLACVPCAYVVKYVSL